MTHRGTRTALLVVTLSSHPTAVEEVQLQVFVQISSERTMCLAFTSVQWKASMRDRCQELIYCGLATVRCMVIIGDTLIWYVWYGVYYGKV